VLDKVTFSVCGATNFDALMPLKQEKPFDKAVAYMIIIDISDINPLFKAVIVMLHKGGSFVFSTHHPCFTYQNRGYYTNCTHKGEAIADQPVLQNYYHRSIKEVFKLMDFMRFRKQNKKPL